MAASASDLFQEVGDPGTATTLSAPGYTIGDTSLTVGSTSNWPTATGITFAMDEIETDASGNEVVVEDSYNEYVGTVASGTSITNVSHQRGTNRNYTAGASIRVYIPISAERENRLVEGMLAEHSNPAGAHASTLITNRTADTTPASGDLILTADVSDSNNLKKATIAQILGNNPTSVGGAWTSYTPTFANTTLGNGSVVGAYTQIGKTVHFRAVFTLGSTSAMGTNPTVTLPVTSATSVGSMNVFISDTGTAFYGGFTAYASTSVLQIYVFNTGTPYARMDGPSSTVPMTWANTDILVVSGTYEAA